MTVAKRYEERIIHGCTIALAYYALNALSKGCAEGFTTPSHYFALQAPGILITPHIGGAVRNMRVRGYDFVLEQLDRYLAKEPLNNVRLHGY